MCTSGKKQANTGTLILEMAPEPFKLWILSVSLGLLNSVYLEIPCLPLYQQADRVIVRFNSSSSGYVHQASQERLGTAYSIPSNRKKPKQHSKNTVIYITTLSKVLGKLRSFINSHMWFLKRNTEVWILNKPSTWPNWKNAHFCWRRNFQFIKGFSHIQTVKFLKRYFAWCGQNYEEVQAE